MLPTVEIFILGLKHYLWPTKNTFIRNSRQYLTCQKCIIERLANIVENQGTII